MNHRLLDYRPAIDALEQPQDAPNKRAESMYSNELQTASELLEHVDKGALESYLHRVIERADTGNTSSAVRAALAGILGRVGRPMLQQTDAKSSASAGRVFGLELEGLSPEDQAFEVARHFARFAKDAARRAASDSGGASAQQVAHRAAAAAAQAFAPGLKTKNPGNRPSTGTWFRRGRELVVLNP